jgi:hypothetical protein
MPPKKEKLSKAQYREIAHRHGVRLKGPVPPPEWPEEHIHHFQAIRTIGDLHYETYRDDRLVASKQRKLCSQRARQLRAKVYELLKDVDINEATWRELEGTIFTRFDENVIWYATLVCNAIKVI